MMLRHPNPFADAFEPGAQTADATHDQVDLDARLRRIVQRGNDVGRDQRVDLGR